MLLMVQLHTKTLPVTNDKMNTEHRWQLLTSELHQIIFKSMVALHFKLNYHENYENLPYLHSTPDSTVYLLLMSCTLDCMYSNHILIYCVLCIKKMK